jgi:hypothetical protein
VSKLLFATAFAALAAFVNTAQASCEEDTLDEVASDGDILVCNQAASIALIVAILSIRSCGSAMRMYPSVMAR